MFYQPQSARRPSVDNAL